MAGTGRAKQGGGGSAGMEKDGGQSARQWAKSL